jgi:glycerol-3-phosphate O-acyltransferase / dihydroxyacetone phosphate acyltransferase
MSPAFSVYRLALVVLRGVVRLFFRRVEVTGLENLPSSGGGIFVAWHPNALVDGVLILTASPRRIVAGARHGLFRWPLLGSLMRSLGVVPVYRRRDFPPSSYEATLREANEKSLDVMAKAVSEGAFALLFPEGQSHDEPQPTELKTGAARLYYRARELTPDGSAPPSILPVGLHYDGKHLYGSSALVAFHPPLELDCSEPPPPGATQEERRLRYRRLTEELDRALREVVHATESWDLHHAMHRARKLMRAEWAQRKGAELSRPDMKERVRAFARLWEGYNERARTHPEEVQALVERIKSYDSDLRALGVEDHELQGGKSLLSPRLALEVALQALLVYFVLPPILVIGYVVNLPAAALVWGVSKWGAGARKDLASLKLVTGAIAFPLVWLLVAFLVGWGGTRLSALYPELGGAHVPTGVLAFVLSAVGALVVLRYQRLARQTFRAIRVRLTLWRRARSLERLRVERAALFDELRRLSRAPEVEA